MKSKPVESAVERSLPWKQHETTVTSSASDHNTNGGDGVGGEECSEDDDISQLPFFSPFLHQWPKHLSPDFSPASNNTVDQRTQPHPPFHNNTHFPSFPNLHYNLTAAASVMHKVSSLNDMHNNATAPQSNHHNHHHATAAAIALHHMQRGCGDSLYGVTEQSICSASSHLPWRDQPSEEPLRCNESRNTCITSSDIESHHRQCITCFQQACEGHGHDPATISFDGGTRRRSHISLVNAQLPAPPVVPSHHCHHNQQDFPHHAMSHLQMTYADSCTANNDKRAHNLLEEPHLASHHRLDLMNEEHYFACLEEKVHHWLDCMEPCDPNEEELDKSTKSTVKETFYFYDSDCGGGGEENDDDSDDEVDFGSDAREFAKLQKAKHLLPLHNDDATIESGHDDLGKPQSFIDYTAQNQLTLRAKPGVSLF